MFPGSHELLVEQNAELDRSQLPRMSNEYELLQSEMSNDLVPVNETEELKVAENLTDTRRYCRPWTRDFLQDLSHAFYEVFHAPLQVNSLVRTADQQADTRSATIALPLRQQETQHLLIWRACRWICRAAD